MHVERVGPAEHRRPDRDELSTRTAQLDALSLTGRQRAEVAYQHTHITGVLYHKPVDDVTTSTQLSVQCTVSVLEQMLRTGL